MVKIKDIVSVNKQATLVKGVQLSDFYNVDKTEENKRLSVGYVFSNSKSNGSDRISSEVSSLTVFNYIRDAFNGYYDKNIFTVIARYGHGKSHFALVLANYFGLPYKSPLLEKIIQHVEDCTDKPTAEHFRSFKKLNQKPQLVLIIAGHEIRDLRQGVLQALRRILDAHEDEKVRNYPIKAISVEAAKWLESLTGENQKRAQEYLAEKHRLELKTLIDDLKNFDTKKEQIAKELSRELFGISGDFGDEISLKEVLTQVVSDLCEGSEAPFDKMLILFDELGVYSERWCENRMAAGHLAPQEIIEACNDKSKKICFVGFIQRELSEIVKDFPMGEECMKWARRLPSENQFKLVSNLEEVISKLVLPKEKEIWADVIRSNAPRLQEEASFAKKSFEKYQSWNDNDFFQIVTRDCFPLHPITTGILCNLDFTQGSRTIIEAVNMMIEEIEDENVNNSGQLNWIKAVKLFDVFQRDFEKQADYSLYENAVKVIGNNEDKINYEVLKALFLFYEGKLKRSKTESHITLLANLLPYSEKEVRNSLGYLENEFGVVRFNSANGEYQFTALGNNSVELLKQLKKEITGTEIHNVTEVLRTREVFENLKLPLSDATTFQRKFAIEGDEWYLEPAFLDAKDLSAEKVVQLCNSTLQNSKARGIIIYLISPNSESLNHANLEAPPILEKLIKDSYPYPVVIGIPNTPAPHLKEKVLLKKKLLEVTKNEQEKYGQSYDEAVERIDKELLEELTRHLASEDNIKYIAPQFVYKTIGTGENNPVEFSNVLFSEFYKFRPPAMSNLLKTNGIKGNTVSVTIGKHLMDGQIDATISAEYKTMIESVLTSGSNKWGVLDSSYKVQDPKNPKIKQAWDEIYDSLDEEKPKTFASIVKKLSFSPYGYDDYTLTLFITAFVGKHKYDLSFTENNIKITLKQFESKLDLKARKFIELLKKGTISVKFAGKENRDKALEYKEKLKTVESYENYQQVVKDYDFILEELEPRDQLRVEISNLKKDVLPDLEKKSKLLNSIKNILRECESSEKLVQILNKEKDLKKLVLENDSGNHLELFTEPFLRIDKLVEIAAKKQVSIPLTKIENYSSIIEKLEKSKIVLNETERTDLVTLYTHAIDRINSDYELLQLQKEEAPLLEKVSGFRTSNMPLKYFEDSIIELQQILQNKVSPNIKEKIEHKQQSIKGEIDKLTIWKENLRDRTTNTEDLTSVQEFRNEIIRNEWKFADSIQAESLRQIVEVLDKKTQELKEKEKIDLKRRQEEAENEQKRKIIEQEKHTIKTIGQEFSKLNDADERFKCLLDIVKIGKAAGLTEKQTKEVINILNQ